MSTPLDRVREATTDIQLRRIAYSGALAIRDGVIRDAVAQGVTMTAVAEAAEVTVARVSQIVADQDEATD